MSKAVKMTAQIEASIRRAVDDPNIDTRNLVVFEVEAANTLPLRKKNLFEKAVISQTVLSQMASAVNARGGAVPLHIMHNETGNGLPEGRAFEAKVIHDASSGQTKLNVLLYIPSTDPERAQLIQDIENSVINEVSISILTKHALCSECGWDYFGPDSSFMNIYDRTCANGHTIGEDGVHVKLTDLDMWFELSLVNVGGAQNAKILSRAKQVMGQDGVEKMAASGNPFDIRVLTASFELKDQPSDEENEMTKELVEKVAALSADLAVATPKLEAMAAEVTKLTAMNTEKDAEIAKLKADAGNEKLALQASLDDANKTISDTLSALSTHVVAALTAMGQPSTDMPKDIPAMLKLIEEKGLKLHQMMGAGNGGKADPSKEGEFSSEQKAVRLSAFKVSV